MDFPEPTELTDFPEVEFAYHSYLDVMARCSAEHIESGLHEGKPASWNDGLQYELYYWLDRISKQLASRDEDLLLQLSRTAFLRPDLEVLLQEARGLGIESSEPFRILDVGSGPLSVLGQITASNIPLRLVTADPLACAYTMMLRQLGVDPPVRAVAVEAERLVTRFQEATFDFVHCRNALDHSWDPFAALEAMIRVVRPGGVVYLLHYRNEGHQTNYTNLHNWDIDITGSEEGTDVEICCQEGQSPVGLRAWLQGAATIAARTIVDAGDRDSHNEMVEIVIRRIRQ